MRRRADKKTVERLAFWVTPIAPEQLDNAKLRTLATDPNRYQTAEFVAVYSDGENLTGDAVWDRGDLALLLSDSGTVVTDRDPWLNDTSGNATAIDHMSYHIGSLSRDSLRRYSRRVSPGAYPERVRSAKSLKREDGLS